MAAAEEYMAWHDKFGQSKFEYDTSKLKFEKLK